MIGCSCIDKRRVIALFSEFYEGYKFISKSFGSVTKSDYHKYTPH